MGYWREFYYQKTKLEKALLCCVILLILVIVILFICFLTSHDNQVCTNPSCIHAASYILNTVNTEADPCNDFYAFACGSFMKSAMLKEQPTTLQPLSNLADNQIKEIVIEDRNDTDLPRSLRYQRIFFKACMDIEAIDKHGYERLFNLLDEVVFGWPAVKMTNWRAENFNWRKSMISARKLGIYYQYFFRIEVYHNNTKSMIWIRPPSEHEIKSFYFNDSNVEIMHNIAKELGADSVDVKTDLRITNTFAEQLREISAKHNNQTRYADFDKFNITIKEILHKLVKFDWLNFLREITGVHLTEKDQVVFDVNDYLTDLYYLFLRTPKKVQANYVGWILISTNNNYLPTKIREQFDSILQNLLIQKAETRRDKCYKLSKNLFPMVAQSEYVRRYTTVEKKHAIQQIVDNIKFEMKELIDSSQWIDIKSRNKAQQRLKNITTYIGWLDIVFNATKLDELSGFNKMKHFPEHGSVIDMARVAMKIKFDNLYSGIRSTSDSIYDLIPLKLEVNAYYLANILILPTPILQGDIFDLKRPNYMNYGALGSIIGHELTHGFSLQSKIQGDDSYITLWGNDTLEKRTEITECVQNEYHSFRYDHGEEKENAIFSIEENLADFNAINIAYTAYQKWVRIHGLEPSLPGIKFTANQMFWIMTSTYMCYEPKLFQHDKIHKKDTNHGIPEFRVVGRIRHSPHFAQDFYCPEGSRMNPKAKCSIYL